jgi:O-antigen/teichoic acid export membrane protein
MALNDAWRRYRIGSLIPIIVAAVVWLPASWLLTGLIASAWEECEDLDAGNRFGLLFLVLPVIMFAAFAAFGSAWFLLKGTQTLRAVIPFIAAMVAAVFVVSLFVPIRGDEDWVGYDPADRSPDTATTALCGEGGIPTWWPAWLPS